MGNLFTKNQNRQIEELESRLQNLETLDANGDGTISRAELNQWKEHQESLISALKDEVIYEREQQHQIQLADLEKQINSLQNTNQQLESKLLVAEHALRRAKAKQTSTNQTNQQNKANQTNQTSQTNQTNQTNQTEFTPGISKEKIHEIAEKWIKNEAININYFPDAIEQQLYKNIINIVLGIFEEVLQTTQIEFMGHVLDAPRLGYYTKQEKTSSTQ